MSGAWRHLGPSPTIRGSPGPETAHVAQSGQRTEVARPDYTKISARHFLVTDEINFGYKVTSTGCATGTRLSWDCASAPARGTTALLPPPIPAERARSPPADWIAGPGNSAVPGHRAVDRGPTTTPGARERWPRTWDDRFRIEEQKSAVATPATVPDPKRKRGGYALLVGQHEPRVADAVGAEIANSLRSIVRDGAAWSGRFASNHCRKWSGSLVLETAKAAAFEATAMREAATHLARRRAGGWQGRKCPCRNGGRTCERSLRERWSRWTA
jgi:hypothetical protein